MCSFLCFNFLVFREFTMTTRTNMWYYAENHCMNKLKQKKKRFCANKDRDKLCPRICHQNCIFRVFFIPVHYPSVSIPLSLVNCVDKVEVTYTHYTSVWLPPYGMFP